MTLPAPKTSVILPVYNGASFVGEAIRSVLLQTQRDLELIVVDDGSTDSTPAILRQFADDRIRIIDQANRGPEAARNRGLEVARGEYVAFQDADDVWFPDKLECQIRVLDASAETALVFGDALIVESQRRPGPVTHASYFHRRPPSRGWVFRRLLQGNFIPQSSVLVRRRCLDEVGPFLELPIIGDYLMWLQIALRHRVDYVDSAVFRYSQHGGNISQNREVHWNSLRTGFRILEQRMPTKDARQLVEKRCFQAELMLALIRLHKLLSGGGRRRWLWAAELLVKTAQVHVRQLWSRTNSPERNQPL